MTLFTLPSWSVSVLAVWSWFQFPSATNCARVSAGVFERASADAFDRINVSKHQRGGFFATRTLYWTLPVMAGRSTVFAKEEPSLSSLTLLDQLSKVPVT